MKLYKDSTYSVSALTEDIGKGKIALPDIQRPFVWSSAQVRNLFDSMYRGYPVGYLLFWQTGVEAGVHQIGADVPKETPAYLIIDGQQRSTALYAVITAKKVMRKDYTATTITIAFRPTDGAFEVGNAAVAQNPEYLPDISQLFRSDVNVHSVINGYINRLKDHRAVGDEEEGRIRDAFEQIRALVRYEFKVVELSSETNMEEISEIFVRINSAGSELNKSDFLLTLMSVFWEKGRQQLEEFCEASRTPPVGDGRSPFNWHLHPKPVQLLRASVALAFRRARLDAVYALLRGRDIDNTQPRLERIKEQFATLAKAQDAVLNLDNWHEYLSCLELAGFRGKKMITSDSAVIYSYVMWLIGRIDYGVPLERLRHLIALWFFMSHTTSRYSGSFETHVERELAQLNQLPHGDAQEFCSALTRIIEDQFTGDYWAVTLPNELATSASKSPVLSGYLAALNILDAPVLLSGKSVRSWLDPATVERKGIERRHLFSKPYLEQQLRVSDRRHINQIANMALVEWPDAGFGTDGAPAEYWPHQINGSQLPEAELRHQLFLHAIPEDWTQSSYNDFLAERRRRMAAVVKEGFERLSRDDYRAAYPDPGLPPQVQGSQQPVSLPDLLDAGVLSAGDILVNPEEGSEALILEDGRIDYDNETYESLDTAAMAAAGGKVDGAQYWSIDIPEGGARTLRELNVDRDSLWKDVDTELVTDNAAIELIHGLWDSGAPAPQFGMDQADGWEAELAWPSRKVAVLNGVDSEAARRMEAFEGAGWQARFAAAWTIEELLRALER